MTSFFKRGSWIGVSRADFSKGVSSVSINGNGNCVVKVCIGNPDAEGVAYVQAGGEANVSGLNGGQDVFFVSNGDCTLNTYQFK